MDTERHSTGRHAAEALLLLGCGALAAVAVLPGLGLPGWALPILVIVAGLVTCLTVWSASGHGGLSLFALFFGTFLGGWLAWAEASKLWNAVTLTAWTAGMLVFVPWGALAVIAARRPRQPQIDAPQEDPEAEHRAEMARFVTMIADAGHEGVIVTDLKDERSGRVLKLALPENGKVTLVSLQASTHAFEVMLKAQPGAVQFETGTHAGEIIMRVREKYVLNENRGLPPELRATTVREPFAIGIQEDGSTLKITIRELHMFVVGTTGAGKSNLINVIIAQLASCVDTVIWVIDMKGGRTVRPWLQAWGEGAAEAPALDWVATTREEAAIMMQAFLGAIETRMNSGIGGSKITPSASTPQIILICDETADLLGYLRGRRSQLGEDATTNTQFIEWAETIAQKGRSEAGSSVWATQRGTNDMAGSGTLKSLCKLRVALGASTEADLRYVIPDARNAQQLMSTMDDLPGVGIIAVRKKASMLTKFYWLDHIEGQCSEGDNERCVPACPVYAASVEVGSRRPRLDAMTATSLGDGYAERWRDERAGHLVKQRGGAATAVADVDTTEFENIMYHGGVKDTEAPVPNPVRVRYRAILRERGVQGATPKYLLDRLHMEGHDVVRETLQRWLRDDANRGLVHQADFGRWVTGADENQSGHAAA
jgi:S-DNA-T family DNA segregation ATPase FtsK/SpoIIIE